jgi:2-keto-4-pentenoate hydratase/2-oxohepta-3-ene-1,7-dioic acid hydratase in catechol pathway
MKSVSLAGKRYYPSKIVCIGRNYVDHITELGNEIPQEPVIFLKPNSSICDEIRTGEDDEIHYEGEITFLVTGGVLIGVGFGLDLTKRQVQLQLKSRGLPWERAKAFDGSAVLSDFVPFEGQFDELRLELFINDHLVQQGGCQLMLNKPDKIYREVSSFLSIEDGDLIMTGTPAGVGPLVAGDRFCGRIFEKDKLLVEQHWVTK